MKKTLIALAALAAGTAFAQSTVTISGGVAVGLQHTAGKESGAVSVNGLKNIDAAGNNLTFAVVEDLGGGLKASATINSRFDPTDGSQGAWQGTRFAQNVKLAVAGGFGEVAMGRFNAPVDAMRGGWDLFNAAGASADAGYGAFGHASDASTRYNGTLQYTSPVFSGFKVAAATAFKDNTAGSGNVAEVALSYVNGPISAGLGFTKNAGATKEKDVVTLGGSYNFGVAKVALTHANVKNDQTVAADDIKRTSLHVSAPVASNIVLKAGFERINSDVTNADSTVVAVGADYILSKRTKVILDAWKKNSDTAATDDKGMSYVLGLKHTF